MLNLIISYALRHRLLVLALTAFVIVYGALSLNQLPIDVFPDITKPTVTILTEAHGMAPEEVETRVTLPLEIQLNGLPGLERRRSQSGIGLSVIYAEFKWGTDIYRSRQLIQEKLNLAKERLPRDVTPIMGPVGSLMGQIQQIAVTSPDNKVSPLELRDWAEWVLRPRLLALSGIAQVISIGGGLKQYQILVSAEKMNRHQLSMEQIDKELTQISQNTTGGFLEKGPNEYLVRNIGVIEGIEDIKRTLVGLHFGRPVLVQDIAEVKEGPRLKRGDGSFNGKPSVVMTIQKQPGADTVRITREIEKVIEEIRPSMPNGMTVHTDVFQQARFIQSSIQGIQGKLKFGTVLVFVVLFLFLANLRMSWITLTAIPVSFLTAAMIFRYLGLSVNTMTLGGLAIAIGELVDDSIVDVENVFRRLRENALKAKPEPRLRVIYDASSEVRNSIVLATIIIALVFLPLFQLSGLEGRLFTPLAVAYLTALVASLVVSLTLTPVLCSYLLKETKDGHHDTRFVTILKSMDRSLLDRALERPVPVLGASAALIVVAALLIPFMGRDFLPRFNEGTAMISMVAQAGISLKESNEMGLKAENALLETKEVKSVSRRTGRAEMDEHAEGVNVSEIDVDFHDGGRPREQVLREIRERLAERIPNSGISIGQPISHLIDHMLSGVSAALAIKIFGPDLTVLREKSVQLKEAIQDVPGLVDLRIEQQGLVPQVKIHVLRDEAVKFNLSPGEVTKLLESAFNGEIVAQVLEETRMYDVFFQFDQDSRGALEKMEQTVLKVMPDGKKVILKDVADVFETYGPNMINREDGQRRVVLSANISERDLGSLVGEIKERVKTKVEMPPGYFVEYGGQFESQQAATQKILLFGVISLIAIAFVLFAHFGSWVITAQVMTTLPLAFVGGLFTLFIWDGSFTVASLIGFVTLCGVASRNSIMMISHYLHLMKYEGEQFSKEMVIRGSQERLVPVLMTAGVATLALLPLALARGQPGSEILHPVALVIVGGLITSTLLDLIVTPTLFYKFGREAATKYVEKQPNQESLP